MLRVPMRDLRMLEPNFSNSYSAAILCRERCIVLAPRAGSLTHHRGGGTFLLVILVILVVFWLSYVHGQLD